VSHFAPNTVTGKVLPTEISNSVILHLDKII